VCNDEIGVQYGGAIDDSQITSSSVYYDNLMTFGPHRGRLNRPFTDEADHWSPRVSQKGEWIQVNILGVFTSLWEI